MAAISITLSDNELLLARNQAAKQGFTRIEEYLRDLVVVHLHDDKESEDFGAPEHLTVTSKDQLQALILEGLESPARERSKADFDKVRQEIIQRHRVARGE